MKDNRGKEQVGFRKGTSLLFSSVLLTSIFLQIVSSLSQAATSFTITNLTANNPVTAGYTRFGNIQLNDAGQAVFPGVNPTITDSQGHPRTDVFFWDGTTLKNVTGNIPGFVVAGPGPYLNKNGQIAFLGDMNFDLGRTKPFFYNGTSVQNLADALPFLSIFREIVINDAGQVAFSGCQQLGTIGACLQPSVYMFNGFVSNIFVDNVTSQSITNLSINARGHVAWLSGSANGVPILDFFNGISIRDVADDPVAKGAGYFQIFDPRLNNADQIIFEANKIGRGDILFFDGSTLRNLTETDPVAGGAGFASFALPALNDAGKAAFVGQELNRPDTSEVFFFDGTILKNLTGADPVAGGAGFNGFSSPQINSTGQLAFVGNKFFVTDSEAIFFFDGTSLKNVTGDASLIGGVVTRINNARHLAFFGKDGTTTPQRFRDVFFFDGTSIPQNLTSGNSLFSNYSFGHSSQEFNNKDQILTLGFTDLTDGTNDVFLFSPNSFPIPPPKVLEPQQQPQYGTVPQPSPQAKGLVLITHGWRDNATDPTGWVIDMKNKIKNQIDLTKWDVEAYDWNIGANTGLQDPWQAVVNAEQEGTALGAILSQRNYDRIHFIAHSAGSQVVNTAAFEIRRRTGARSPSCDPDNPDLSGPIIHATFLDAYDPNRNASLYGRCSNYAEQYVDMRTVFDKKLDDTNLILNWAFNFSVTDLDPDQSISLIPQLDAFRVHAWPHVWYHCSVNPPDQNCQSSDFGFPLSLETGKQTLPSHKFISLSEPYFRRSDSCILSRNFPKNLRDCQTTLLAGSPTSNVIQNTPLDFTSALTTNQLLASNTGNFNFPTPNSVLMATGSPVWISVFLRINSYIDSLRFDYQFLSNAEGLLSVFFDNQVVYKADERITTNGINSSRDVWIGDIDPGDHVLSFRLDGFSGMQSLVQLSNIRTGVLSVNQPPVASLPKQLTSLAPAKLWVGLKNSDDQGTFFDVRADVLKNGSPITSGVSKNIQGVTRNPDQAKEVTVVFGSISNSALSPGDNLSLRVLAKVADSGGHNNAVGLRLYYDAASRPSRFGAEITPDPLKSFFLDTAAGDFLNSTSPTGTTPKQKDSPSVDRKTFKEIGTWSMTVP
jgi:hypothetical protein